MNHALVEVLSKSWKGIVDADRRHRAWLLLGALLAAVLTIALAIYGWDYYILDLAQRPFSPKHPLLRPSGAVGLRLGMLGMALFFLVYLYPLRKRWPWLARKGKTRNWLDYHVLMGIVAPVIVTFHASFKARGFAGMAYWTMLALTASGLIGRYVFAQIPRRLGAAELSMREMEELGTQLAGQLAVQEVLSSSALERFLRLPSVREVQGMSLARALLEIMWLDMTRPFMVGELRRKYTAGRGRWRTMFGLLPTGEVELERAIGLVRRQAVLAKKVLFLSKVQRVFHLWHVVHRPFSFTFAILVLIHFTVVLLLGYY